MYRTTSMTLKIVATKLKLTNHVLRSFSQCYACTQSYSKRSSHLRQHNSSKIFPRFVTTFAIEKDVMKSFAKDLFIAKINLEWMFPFPTLDTNKELHDLNESIKPLQDFFSQNIINSAEMDENAEIHPELYKELKELRLFGMKIPQEYGGLGLSNLKYARFCEVIAEADMSVNMMLASHNLLAVQPILTAGNDEQIKKYMPRMATGELIGAFCLNEVSAGSDITAIKARATLSEDQSHWILNGEKTSVNNGGIADVMIVFAKTEVSDVGGVKKDTITAFIVEREFGGVYNGPQEDKLGMRALNTCDVMFDETIVPVSNVLGEVGQGFKIATETTNYARLGMVTGVIGQSRKLVNAATEYANVRKQFGKPLKDFELIQEKIFQMSMRTYVMESMAYLTLGKMDQALEEEKIPDLSVDYAIAKIYCSEAALQNANDCIDILGYRGYTKSFPYERILRDTKMFTLAEGNNDVLRLYIALACLQQTETDLNHRLSQIKVGSFRQKFTSMIDNYRDDYGTSDVRNGMLRKKIPSFGLTTPKKHTEAWFDPYLEQCGFLLEGSLQTFYRRVYSVVQHYGKQINDRQLHLRRIADAGICLYSISAVLARCNKSLVLGLRHREHERLMTQVYVQQAGRRCEHVMEELKGSFKAHVDPQTNRVGKELLEERRYTCSHPLELEHNYEEHPKYIEQFEKVKTLSEK